MNKVEHLGRQLKEANWEAPRRLSNEAEVYMMGWSDGSMLLIPITGEPHWLVSPEEANATR